MPANAIGPLILFLALLLTTAHLLGHLFTRLRQPRVIGEILAGIVLGPFVLGKLPGYAQLLQLEAAAAPKKAALDLLYQMGLLLLMFLSGAETKALFQKQERKQIAWLAVIGKGAAVSRHDSVRVGVAAAMVFGSEARENVIDSGDEHCRCGDVDPGDFADLLRLEDSAYALCTAGAGRGGA
jgi:Kef-type K+ transport system membrane component KefB